MRGIIAFALIGAALSGHAQNKTTKNIFAADPFDTTVNNLPIGYKGHDCKSISSALKKFKLKKDEFETTADFESRMIAVSENKISSKLAAGDLLAFKRGGYQDVTVKYSADDRILSIEAKPMTYSAFVAGRQLTWDNVNVSRKESFYRASNAYGATVTVTKTDLNTCSLAFSNINTGLFGTIDVVIKDASPELAKRAKSGVSYFYIGMLERPFISNIYESSPPKIDYPFETNWRGDALVFKLLSTWVVENKTGEVLGKNDF